MRDYVYYVYIATNHPRQTVLYTGVTKSIIRRDGQHKEKDFPNSFTAKYNANRIVYFEVFSDIHIAISREKQIKRLVRRKKIELINSMNPGWKDLADELWRGRLK